MHFTERPACDEAQESECQKKKKKKKERKKKKKICPTYPILPWPVTPIQQFFCLALAAAVMMMMMMMIHVPFFLTGAFKAFNNVFKTLYSLNSRDLFLNLRRLVKMTKPLRFENKSLRLKYKCLICI